MVQALLVRLKTCLTPQHVSNSADDFCISVDSCYACFGYGIACQKIFSQICLIFTIRTLARTIAQEP